MKQISIQGLLVLIGQKNHENFEFWNWWLDPLSMIRVYALAISNLGMGGYAINGKYGRKVKYGAQ